MATDLGLEAFVALDAGAWALDQAAADMATRGLMMSSLEMAHQAAVLRQLREDAIADTGADAAERPG
jgi:hypothetical protein